MTVDAGDEKWLSWWVSVGCKEKQTKYPKIITDSCSTEITPNIFYYS